MTAPGWLLIYANQVSYRENVRHLVLGKPTMLDMGFQPQLDAIES